MYFIKNCKIIKSDEILENHGVIIENRRIKEIDLEELLLKKYKDSKELIIIDGKAAYLTAGFIDIHSDYIESILAPRPTSLISFELGLKEAEKVFLTSGITTIYHSLAIYDDEVECKEIRKGENIKKIINVINDYKTGEVHINHRIHARFEIDCINEVNNLIQLIGEGKIDLLSIMDHSPGQGQYRNLEIYKNIIKEYKNCTDEKALEIIKKAQNKEKITLDGIKTLVEIARENSVEIASHDDDSIEKIDLIKELNIKISEFPITLEAAFYAKEKGLYTVGGAPNILLGGSHSGNLSMSEAISNDVIDALCSDYYPQAMLHVPFILKNNYNIPLTEGFKLITLNPAKLLKIDKEYGSIEKGKMADLLLINKNSILPEIEKVFVAGQLKLEIN